MGGKGALGDFGWVCCVEGPGGDVGVDDAACRAVSGTEKAAFGGQRQRRWVSRPV